ncbi:MAG: 4Fe-4S binding protein [Thermoplasmatales archaeon]|nr:4Fe-4S binding protein [Thermoplasmatales archaeon]
MIKEPKISENQREIWREPLNFGRFAVPKGEIHIFPERCKECNYCTNYCPNQVLERSPEVNVYGYHPVRVREDKKDSCVACGMCQSICPDFAIFVKEVKIQ